MENEKSKSAKPRYCATEHITKGDYLVVNIDTGEVYPYRLKTENIKYEDDKILVSTKKIKEWVFWNGKLTGKECRELIKFLTESSTNN